MKKFLLSALLLVGVGAAQAKTIGIFSSNYGNGLTLANGTAVTNAEVRFGTFPSAFVFTNKTEAELDTAFTEVFTTTINLNAQSTSGFYDIASASAVDSTATLDSVPYDSSAASTADVGGDIAGERIYIWITPTGSAEHFVASVDALWPDGDELFADVHVSPDSGTKGLTAHLGSLASGGNIGAGAAAHATTNPFGLPVVTRTPMAPSVYNGTRVTFTATVNGPGPFAYQWQKDGIDIPGATSSTYMLNPARLTDDGNYRVVLTNLVGTPTSAPVSLDVFSTSPVITQDPFAEIVYVGSTLNLTASAQGAANMSYAWKKGTTAVGATTTIVGSTSITTPRSITNVQLSNAGAYTVTVTNSAGSDVSTPAQVTVVNGTGSEVNIAPGGNASLSIAAAAASASFISYQWYKGADLATGTPITNGGRFSGATSATFMITGALDGTDEGNYFCLVSGPGGELVGGNHTVDVSIPTAPELNDPQNMPDAIIGGLYNYTVGRDPAIGKKPTSYAFGVLPTGLTGNTTTGVITGRPTTVGTYNITITATNPQGSDMVTDTIQVLAFPASLAGTYTALIERSDIQIGGDPLVDGELGGRVTVTVTATGGVTGSAVVGATTLTFPTGQFLNVPVQTPGTPLPAPFTCTILRTGKPNIVVSFEVTGNSVGEENLLVNGSLTSPGSADQLAFDGFRTNFWSTSGNPATHYTGLYTAAIGLQDGDPNEGVESIPQGFGYTSFTVGTAGTLTLAGKTPDGESITGGTSISPTGRVIIFQTLYTTTPKGSLHGDFDIEVNSTATTNDNTLLGATTQLRPFNPSATHRLYKAGFGPYDQLVTGGRYVAPVSPTRILGLTSGTANARILFEGANLPESILPTLTLPSVAVNVGTTIVVPTNATLTKFNAGSPSATAATFAGTYTQPVKAGITFQGLIVPIDGVQTGVGYTIVDQLPSGSPSTTSPQLSGAVFFEQNN